MVRFSFRFSFSFEFKNFFLRDVLLPFLFITVTWMKTDFLYREHIFDQCRIHEYLVKYVPVTSNEKASFELLRLVEQKKFSNVISRLKFHRP